MATIIITRADARDQGLKRYLTGIPCRHGHLSERRVCDGKCSACMKPKAAIRSKRWASLNPEKLKAKTLRWREAHPDEWRDSNHRSKQARQQIYTDRQRADYALNPEKYRTVERKRRAIMRGSSGTHTAADLAEILAAQGNRCAYCKVSLKGIAKHVDHIKPLARRGSNGRANLQYLCRACNQAKSAKDPLDFANSIGLLL